MKRALLAMAALVLAACAGRSGSRFVTGGTSTWVSAEVLSRDPENQRLSIRIREPDERINLFAGQIVRVPYAALDEVTGLELPDAEIAARLGPGTPVLVRVEGSPGSFELIALDLRF